YLIAARTEILAERPPITVDLPAGALALTLANPPIRIDLLAHLRSKVAAPSTRSLLPPRSTAGQLTLDQHIGVRIPGGQPILRFMYPQNLGPNHRSTPILLVANLLHPVHRLTIQLFLNSNVRHRRGRAGAMPMLFGRRNPDHIPRPNLLNRPARPLRAATSGGDDQGLTERFGDRRRRQC